MENAVKTGGLIPKNAVEYARKTLQIGIFGVKNNFVLAGILAIGFCVIAPAIFVMGTMESTHDFKLSILWDIMGVYSVIAAYVGGLMIPAVMFSYVHMRRDRDFYHSMPVKRGQYFIGYLGAGFVMFAAPYLIMCFIMGLLGGAVDIAFDYVLHTLVLYIIIYATTLLAMMFSGSKLSSIVTLAFLNTFTVIVTYCSLLMAGNLDINAYMTMVSPYIYIFTPLSGGYSFYEVFAQGPFYWVIWVQLGIAAAELVLAFIMYKYRRGETTMAVAFPKTRYILQYGAMFLVGLFCTSTYNSMYMIFGHGGSHIGSESIILTAIMVFVTFILMNMILEQNFRAAFHRIRHLFVFAGAYAVVLALIIGMVSGLPYWVVPIKTDIVLIQQARFTLTYDKPEDYEGVYWDYDELYSINNGYFYYVVSDPEQVKELTGRISDHMNHDRNEEVRFLDEPGEYCSVIFYLYTLKPGSEIRDGMNINEIDAEIVQSYAVYIGYVTPEGMEYYTEGMDMIKTDYPHEYY